MEAFFCVLLLILKVFIACSPLFCCQNAIFFPTWQPSKNVACFRDLCHHLCFQICLISKFTFFHICSDCWDLLIFKGTKFCLGEHHGFISPCPENLSLLGEGFSSQLSKAPSSPFAFFLYLERVLKVSHHHQMWPLFKQQQQRTAKDEQEKADGER